MLPCYRLQAYTHIQLLYSLYMLETHNLIRQYPMHVMLSDGYSNPGM